MFFLEVFVPRGSLTPERRERLARRLTSLDGLTGGEAMHPGTAAAVREVMHVVFHEPETWWSADGPVDARNPRYLVRVHVPNAWRRDLSEPFVRFVTDALAETDEERRRLREEPVAEVHVIGVPERGYGLRGRVLGASDLVAMLGDPFRRSRESGDDDGPVLPEGSVYDPMCGAIVKLGPDAVTLERDGRTYGFCCEHCRRLFISERRTSPEGSTAGSGTAG
ncbi:YHS domain protein [Spirillospora sp. NPDC048832]